MQFYYENITKILQRLLTFGEKCNILKTDNKTNWRVNFGQIGDIIVGMDIGTSKVSMVIGEVNNFNQIEVIYTDSQKCSGIKKGKIIDEDEIVLAVTKLIKNAEIDANLTINSTYITIPGKYVTIVQNSIVKEAKDRYAGISMKDVSSSIMQVRDIEYSRGKTNNRHSNRQIYIRKWKNCTRPSGKLEF